MNDNGQEFFKMTCPKCGQPIECPNELYDQLIDCPSCSNKVLGRPDKNLVEVEMSSTRLPGGFSRKNIEEPTAGNLIKCKDCGSMVSKNAKACPKCGLSLKRTSALALGCGGLLVLFLIIFVIGLFFSGSGTSPSERKSAIQNYKSLTHQSTYYDVIKALGQPDKEIEERDVPLPNIVLGYAREQWIVYVMYSDRSFDKEKSFYAGIVSTTGIVIHAADEKTRVILEALAEGIKK
ncbi:MAG: hypothetical protein WDM80_06980 [Limisphaerales bacterium]